MIVLLQEDEEQMIGGKANTIFYMMPYGETTT